MQLVLQLPAKRVECVLPPINNQTCLAANQVVASCVIASHADVLRGSSRVPAPRTGGQERVTNRCVNTDFELGKITRKSRDTRELRHSL